MQEGCFKRKRRDTGSFLHKGFGLYSRGLLKKDVYSEAQGMGGGIQFASSKEQLAKIAVED